MKDKIVYLELDHPNTERDKRVRLSIIISRICFVMLTPQVVDRNGHSEKNDKGENEENGKMKDMFSREIHI